MSTRSLESLNSDIELREGLHWPKADEVAFDHVKMYLPLLQLAARQATEKRIAVQAGGNAGMYPVELAKMFDKVITFEPEFVNYKCLCYNSANLPNIGIYQAVLGNDTKPVSLVQEQGLKNDQLAVNTGAFHVEGGGDIPQMRIDDLDLPHLDFLQLDVEGWELNALEGAERTIRAHWPVIMLEIVQKRGYAYRDPEPFVLDLGYSRIIKGEYDRVYIKHDGSDNVQ